MGAFQTRVESSSVVPLKLAWTFALRALRSSVAGGIWAGDMILPLASTPGCFSMTDSSGNMVLKFCKLEPLCCAQVVWRAPKENGREKGAFSYFCFFAWQEKGFRERGVVAT